MINHPDGLIYLNSFQETIIFFRWFKKIDQNFLNICDIKYRPNLITWMTDYLYKIKNGIFVSKNKTAIIEFNTFLLKVILVE